MADKRISQLVERINIANNDVLPIVAFGATTTNKVTVSTLQDWMQDNLDVGVTSVGLSVPSAFSVSGSPVTTSGNITISGAGTTAQYIRGDGSLADFPSISGGGSSVSYYLNGSVSQGTIGGVAYREINKVPILGAGTDITINTNGYIASFITDAGDPSLLEIPGGNWNFETVFSANSNAGNPSFYIELYKVSAGGTATLIASNSATPEGITFGSTIHSYFSALAVPTTTLTITDRLALRYYVTNSGRTITLHTENGHLCQVITTFTTGLTALNGLTAQVQNFATGTSGTDFNISSASTTHTFNLPDASASNRGVVTTGSQVFGGVKTFSNGLTLPSAGGTNQASRFVNIGTIHEGSAGSTQIGFNNSNNIYFGKGLSNGGVIQWTNSAVRYYTLPDADGTLALTSDLGNYIQGSGTADSIPKFTGARTIANSAIRDTTSTVIISKNVSVDNGASQAINLTPASGGTTNRIETTGTLPLSLVTSGASITLAAGGTTPQITLASTGAVTLTGALNGTSATFSGNVTAGNKLTVTNPSSAQFSNATIELVSYNGTAPSVGTSLFSTNHDFVYGTILSNQTNLYGVRAGGIRIATGVAPIVFSNGNADIDFATPRLTIASTGAATFSSSVTATQGLTVGSLGSGSNAIITLANNASGSPRTIYYKASDATINFTGTGGSDQVTITNGGNVGIGTASPTTYSLAGRHLEVNDAGGGFAFLHNNTTSVKSFFAANESGGVAALFTFSNHPLTFGTNNTERMRITSGGYLVLGGSSSVYGQAGRGTFEMNGSADNMIAMRVGGSLTGYLYTNSSSMELYSTNPLILSTAGSERARISSGGFLKASNYGAYNSGVTSTYHELRSNQEDQWISVIGNIAASPYGINIFYNNATPNNADNWFIYCNDNTNVRFRVASNGNVTNTNGSYGSISDAKLKENITDASPKLEDLLKVKIRNYNLIGEDTKQIGVIAQELEEVFPAMIDESEDFEEVEVPQLDEEGNEVLNEEGEVVTEKQRVSKGTTTKSVKYSVFVPMLIKAIQELKIEIDSLKNQIK
jgi:hypothetical protein